MTKNAILDTLSTIATYIGVFAYLFIHTADWSVLVSAAGRNARSTWPSWIPDWRKGSLRSLQDPARCNWTPSLLDIYPDDRFHRQQIQVQYGLDWQSFYPVSWNKEVFVDRSNAALSIKLVHLAKPKSQPSVKSQIAKNTFEVIFGTLRYKLVLKVDEPLAVEPSEVGKTHLFIFSSLPPHILRKFKSCLLLTMKETSQASTYRLLDCCVCDELFIVCGRTLQNTSNENKCLEPDPVRSLDDGGLCLMPWLSLADTIRDLQMSLDFRFQYGKKRAEEWRQENPGWPSGSELHNSEWFCSTVLLISQHIPLDIEYETPDVDLYLNILRRRYKGFEPKLMGSTTVVEFVLRPEQWSPDYPQVLEPFRSWSRYDWMFSQNLDESIFRELRSDNEKFLDPNKNITFRVTMKSILHEFLKSTYWLCFKHLSNWTKSTGLTAIDLALRKPTAEDEVSYIRG